MRAKRIKLLILSLIFLANVFAWNAVGKISQPQSLEVVFFDVGQGDAIFIKTPEGHNILIDGGPSGSILERLSEVMFFWDREIDLIILSHAHSDHVGGLIEVVPNYEVRNILWNGAIDDNAVSRAWERVLNETDATIRIAKAGQRIKGKTFYIDILYPFDNLANTEIKDLNLSSVIARLVSNEGTFLFTGDVYSSIEKELIKKEDSCKAKNEPICRSIVLKSDVLKVGHHGSKTSTSEEFLKRVNPSIAVIQSGSDNRYGHPHIETLEILKKHGIRVLRNDLDGNIKILSSFNY